MTKINSDFFMEDHKKYFDDAFDEAFSGVRTNQGGPFGAVVVLNGTIIGKGCNHVIGDNDPTAHAEIVAIRDACRKMNCFDLSGAVIYSTCEPCPMCLSAIYWANISGLYFCSTRHHAEEVGFKDNHIYNELNVDIDDRSIPTVQVEHPMAKVLLDEWIQKSDKTPY